MIVLYPGNITPKNGRADSTFNLVYMSTRTNLKKEMILHIYRRYLENFNRMSMKREKD